MTAREETARRAAAVVEGGWYLAPGAQGRQTHRAATEDFGIILSPARGKAVGARVLVVDRVDLPADEQAHAPPVAGRSRCRDLAERGGNHFARNKKSSSKAWSAAGAGRTRSCLSDF